MKIYQCKNCGNLLYFENDLCLQCRHSVGFDPENLSFITLDVQHSKLVDITHPKNEYRYCENHQYGVCNWLIRNDQANQLCLACSLNGTIPSLDLPENIEKWRKLEMAKHRLIYSMLRLNLPFQVKKTEDDPGLQFDFLNDVSPDSKIFTGHNQGVITINAAEADEVERVSTRVNLREKYRTLLGHFRHEIGHYYWDRLVKDGELLQKFRTAFGDETLDYQEALQQHYDQGAPSNWTDNHISPYATAHPWEDWAETWSHYLHMMDTLETAHTFGVAIQPGGSEQQRAMGADIRKDPYTCDNFDEILAMWFPLTFAVNSLNRSMGHIDFYPFVISNAVIEKLKVIHEICRKFNHEEKKTSSTIMNHLATILVSVGLILFLKMIK